MCFLPMAYHPTSSHKTTRRHMRIVTDNAQEGCCCSFVAAPFASIQFKSLICKKWDHALAPWVILLLQMPGGRSLKQKLRSDRARTNESVIKAGSSLRARSQALQNRRGQEQQGGPTLKNERASEFAQNKCLRAGRAAREGRYRPPQCRRPSRHRRRKFLLVALHQACPHHCCLC